MTPEEYTQEVMRTCGIKSTGDYRDMLMLGALGVAGESGEVADIIKKHVYHGHALNMDKLIDEIGDVLWYLTVLAKSQHYDLGEVMERNIEKLRKRYPQGFDEERSKNRVE